MAAGAEAVLIALLDIQKPHFFQCQNHLRFAGWVLSGAASEAATALPGFMQCAYLDPMADGFLSLYRSAAKLIFYNYYSR